MRQIGLINQGVRGVVVLLVTAMGTPTAFAHEALPDGRWT